MKHEILPQSFEKIEFGAPAKVPLTRKEKLERWATVLEQHRGPLKVLHRIEYLSSEQRAALRSDDSALSIAFADPVLRAAGLSDDRLGEAIGFFEITEDEAHHLLCDCHYHGPMTSSGLASRVRVTARHVTMRQMWDKARGTIAGYFGRPQHG